MIRYCKKLNGRIKLAQGQPVAAHNLKKIERYNQGFATSVDDIIDITKLKPKKHKRTKSTQKIDYFICIACVGGSGIENER